MNSPQKQQAIWWTMRLGYRQIGQIHSIWDDRDWLAEAAATNRRSLFLAGRMK
jgi:hypothetical protein